MASTTAHNAASTTTDATSTKTSEHVTPPSWGAYAIGVILVGTSAGMLLYTRKTGSMLKTLEHVKQPLQKPKRVGPPTKEEWEKIRPRFDDDDIV